MKFIGRFSGIVEYADNTHSQFAVQLDEKSITSASSGINNNPNISNQTILELQTDHNWLQNTLALVTSELTLDPTGNAIKTVTAATIHFSGRVSRQDGTWEDFGVEYDIKQGGSTILNSSGNTTVYDEFPVELIESWFGAITTPVIGTPAPPPPPPPTDDTQSGTTFNGTGGTWNSVSNAGASDNNYATAIYNNFNSVDLNSTTLRLGGGNIGTGKSLSGLTGTDTIFTQGGPTDLWGTSLTAADVNDVDFGFQSSATEQITFQTMFLEATGFGFSIPSNPIGIEIRIECRTPGPAQWEVDHMEMKVYW